MALPGGARATATPGRMRDSPGIGRRGSPESTVRLCRICVGNLDGGEELYVEAWCAHTDLRCSDIIGSKATPFRQCLQCRAMAISTRQIDRAQLGAVQEDPLPVQEAAEDVPVRNELQVAVELEEPRGPACPALSAVAAPVTPGRNCWAGRSSVQVVQGLGLQRHRGLELSRKLGLCRELAARAKWICRGRLRQLHDAFARCLMPFVRLQMLHLCSSCFASRLEDGLAVT